MTQEIVDMNIFSKKRIWETIVLILLIGIGLTGCATSQRSAISKPEKPFFSFNDQADQAPDPVLNQTLPNMTGRELEALGDRQFSSKDYYMAFVQYGKALKLDPDNARLIYKQGLILLETGKYDDALKAFQSVVDKQPGYAAAHEGMGTALLKMQQYELAAPHLQQSLELNPGSWKARNLLGNIYDIQEKYDMASREYADAILLNPHDGMLYNNLGVSLSLAGRYEESLSTFKRALNANGSKDIIYNNLGLVLARMGRYDAALSAFKQGADTARAYNNLGCVLMAQGEYQKAAQSFNQAIAASPKFYETAYENLKKVEMRRF
jgi:Flp pilus assembly protein TadD